MSEILLASIAILLILSAMILLRVYKSGDSKALEEIKSSINTFDTNFSRFETAIKDEFKRNREELSNLLRDNRLELNSTLQNLIRSNEDKLDKMTTAIESKLQAMIDQFSRNAKENRDELNSSLKSFESQFAQSVKDFNELQRQKFDELANKQTEQSHSNEQKLEKMRETIELKLKDIQDDNSSKLEKMRQTVDEKLHETLEKRLGESFKIVSDRLEVVHKGLGEMQALATGVGDLKKVLIGVKTKGILGEIQLANILEEILAPEQYDRNVKTNPNSRDIVEFAVKLPGKLDGDFPVWLPIDSKFPTEPYQLLLDAYESAIPEKIEYANKQLAATIKSFAKDIRDKYINPPNTTDFAIMFLPFEGLYAEVLRNAGLFETLQRDYKVVITGPTTLSATLSSLQMGFRTLAIEKRSSEVWNVLGAVKKEFERFGDVLKKAQDKIRSADKELDTLVGTRTNQIKRALKDVQTDTVQEYTLALGDGVNFIEDENMESE